MLDGLLKIAREIDSRSPSVYKSIRSDIAIYFYPYISSQLSLPFREYIKMVVAMSRVGMGFHPLFIIHCVIGFVLKKRGMDFLISSVRKCFNKTPRIGF